VIEAIDPQLDSYFVDIFENTSIVEHKEFMDGVLTIWENNHFSELVSLEKDLKKLVKQTRKTDGFDLPEISDNKYVMY